MCNIGRAKAANINGTEYFKNFFSKETYSSKLKKVFLCFSSIVFITVKNKNINIEADKTKYMVNESQKPNCRTTINSPMIILGNILRAI